ncbi:MAG: ATP-binding cassette domain-containing protein [Proteobacteria bacterium]|nr:ATP-binding cassette domain-containing protein [Pseudomonadota bacterium]
MNDAAPAEAATQSAKPSRNALRPLRTLWPYLRRYPWLIAGWLGFLVVSSSSVLVLPVAVRLMVDRGFSHAGSGAIDEWFLLLLAVAMVMALATAGRFLCVSLLGERVVADLRRDLYGHLLRLDIGFFERTRTGELISRLSADTELLRTVVASSMSIALRSTITALGAATMLVVTSPRLAGMAAIGIPLVVLPIVVFGRRVRGMSRASQDRTADANARAGETLNAMHTVQSYARENFESERYAGAVEDAYGAARRRIRTQAILTASVIVLVFGAVVGVLWLGAHDVIDGHMSAGTLMQFVFYAVFGAGSVGSLSEVWAEVQRAGGGMGRINDLLEETPRIVAPATPQQLPSPAVAARANDAALAFEHVRFHYPARPDTPALDDFSLAVKRGETVALVGPSGAGKSTVFQLLLRFHDPDAGSVRMDGIDLRELDPQALRRRLALVPQDPVIFGADARDNIRYGRLDASDDDVIAAARMAEAHEFLAALPEGYRSFLGEKGTRLSGGQQQRLAIARAVLKDAPILLLDEATSALDAQSERAIQQAFERLRAGRTTLVIAHRLATVLRADRIVVMDRGRIVAQGTHEQLVAQGGLYAELARLQFAA